MSSQRGLDRRICRRCQTGPLVPGCPLCEARGFVLARFLALFDRHVPRALEWERRREDRAGEFEPPPEGLRPVQQRLR
jgi:hypothetical protein